MLTAENIYPVTIVMDRYTGTYSHGLWVALRLTPDDIPDDIGAGDSEEQNFWDNWRAKHPYPIGLGDSPTAAVEDLIRDVKRWQSENGYEVGV